MFKMVLAQEEQKVLKWNICNITDSIDDDRNDIFVIHGISPTTQDLCLSSIITKTTLADAMSSKYDKYKYKNNYHEGYGLSVVNSELVYILDIEFHKNKNLYEEMSEKVQIPATCIDYKEYLNLPALVYAQWIGMICTVL